MPSIIFTITVLLMTIDSINYVTGIGNGSRELIIIIHVPANNHCWNMLEVHFEQFKQKNEFFTKNQAPGTLECILSLRYSLLCLSLLNSFKEELGYKDLLTFIAEFCLIFSLWASRALVYYGRNLWTVDLCSVDLRWWNWRGRVHSSGGRGRGESSPQNF